MLNLRSESEILNSWIDISIHPKVSVCCFTYNHEYYIKTVIDSILNQKTTFPIELIIHDDNSNDATKDLILEYCKLYPRIIKPILQSINQHSVAGYRVLNAALDIATGDYIAWCDGDDYWTIDSKLQKQVETLESDNGDIIYSDLDILYSNGNRINKIFENKVYPDYKNSNDFILKGAFKGPCTWLWKRQLLPKIPEKNILSTDISFYVMSYFITFHKVAYLPLSTAVYRINAESMTHTKNLNNHYMREQKLFFLQQYIVNEFDLPFHKDLDRMYYVKFFFMTLVLYSNKFSEFLYKNKDIIKHFKPSTKRELMIYIISYSPMLYINILKIYYKIIGFNVGKKQISFFK